MKRSLGIRSVFIFLLALLFAGPAYSATRHFKTAHAPSSDSRAQGKDSFSLLHFYHDQLRYFQSSLHPGFRMGGMDVQDAFFKPLKLTTEFLNLPELPSIQFDHSSNHVITDHEFNNPPKQSRYADLSENLKSPVLVPYKYKTLNNMMISLILPIEATDHITVVPMVSYIFCMNGSARNDLKERGLSLDKEENIFYGGINLTYSF